MKYLIGLVLVIGLLLGGFWWLNEHQKSQPVFIPGKEKVDNRSWTAAIMDSPKHGPVIVTPTPVGQGLRTNNPGSSGSRAPVVTMRYRSAVDTAARTAGVRITSYNEVGTNVTVKLEWVSDNAAQGGDFLDAMIQGGMRDFDDLGKLQAMRDGRRVFMGSYRLKF